MKKQIEIYEKEANAYDKALAIITSDRKKVRFSERDYKYATEWLRNLTVKTHAIYLTSENGCPNCNGLQTNLYNGNTFYCPYCGQKLKAKIVNPAIKKEEEK